MRSMILVSVLVSGCYASASSDTQGVYFTLDPTDSYASAVEACESIDARLVDASDPRASIECEETGDENDRWCWVRADEPAVLAAFEDLSIQVPAVGPIARPLCVVEVH